MAVSPVGPLQRPQVLQQLQQQQQQQQQQGAYGEGGGSTTCALLPGTFSLLVAMLLYSLQQFLLISLLYVQTGSCLVFLFLCWDVPLRKKP